MGEGGRYVVMLHSDGAGLTSPATRARGGQNERTAAMGP